jgi:hypothetical protein
MVNPVQNAFNVSRQVHKRIMPVDVTISRGLLTSGTVVATIGFSGDMVFDGEVTHYTKHRAFLIDITEYTVDSVAVSPVRHDIITQTVNGVVTEFQVVDHNATSADNYDDTNRTFWRVNTKEK